jgi:hypothetical protein
MAAKRDHAAEWQRTIARAHEQRDEMRRGLGGKCSHRGCGVIEGLEFNHTRGRSWDPARCNYRQRMRLYFLDYQTGRLSLLCRKHNQADARKRAAALAAAKAPESTATETHKAVRDLPRRDRPARVRRRLLKRKRPIRKHARR